MLKTENAFRFFIPPVIFLGREQTNIPDMITADTENFGDFAQNEDEELDVDEVAEPWYYYDEEDNPHVFYPICMGKVLKDRYLVEYKLGFGGGSTVWMAHDLQDRSDVALKVMASGEWGGE